ncbi:mimitin, mitochondrial [Dorcoceras hygrometricum]|uniref:NADH dehydrogenase [ubiquinone] 1 alpha subcomplex subunit 12 n=1 Tax=Dorcoceras hygrometricum TaxID=472368 RepID=A0A2Z7BL15_9LAMI|nr:mimitin, mitochondrial [Dorcoceras hygrometricum]
MSRLWARLFALFSSKTFSGVDKLGNRYYARHEELDGVMKEKRWVEFKGEHEPTSIPVEWICWLNGQRKRAPTPEEMAELEARRERVRLSVALLKKEEEEQKAKEGKATNIGKAAGPDLKSFIRQFPSDSEGNKIEASDSTDVTSDKGSKEYQSKKDAASYIRKEPRSSEPTGTGESFRPGTWQP